MQKVAIIFSSTYGQTRKIVQVIYNRLAIVRDFDVSWIEISKNNPNPSLEKDTDVVIIGAPIYAGRFPRPLLKWVRNHRKEIEKMKSAFFSVSLNAADPRPESQSMNQILLASFVEKTNWDPDQMHFFAGALAYTRYPWWKRYLMKRISAAAKGPVDTTRDFELTNWSQVANFTESFIDNQKVRKQNRSSNLEVV